ncbi:MAG: nucleoside-diphosphate kinase [Candidatus Yanofskybacteria bacterium RIFCSPHIGHO2_01_FULL_43_42]|uniref:Nucleoside diphosphate kinase n=1 Tax=Candidatus Yanofskybacteria bacterium RIFCSPLOWO2_01_FULL_43_22 TaxID=1802695 RepID=A0A1F8GE97_9BACT|nr:MAG: nucleoside-diphosphate kinase [Candidatus Yanofskybacteria bacterium RIFCSPHIGHO2_01_FULL_43_42]OGN12558.1 MAG: nucleoside-diphosphate kinase [Candidatus Yanofskybacteria bacterium RIFCSPHIGHO2_02_FULL_43_17]OGN23705.1 MAG: nucleoside-diphosphate kinase [Candidatus Yanofskybacteria bacterium RIFCSPLOWO2_01_FULL_43_22]
MANSFQKTLVILKPDSIHRGIVGEILDRFEQKGIKIVGAKMIKMTDLLLDKHYAQHKGKHFLPRLKKFMKSLPVVLVVLEGLDVVRVVRNMCGPTDGKNAPPGTIRGDYGMSISANIIHSSEDLKAAKREIGIFFNKNEIFSYLRPDIHFYYDDGEI